MALQERHGGLASRPGPCRRELRNLVVLNPQTLQGRDAGCPQLGAVAVENMKIEAVFAVEPVPDRRRV